MKTKCSALVLAAGESRRMGEPKPFLKWDENTTFLEKIINDFLTFGCAEIVVLLNEKWIEIYEQNNYTFLKTCKVVINKHLELERFYSVKLGVAALKPDTERCFIHNTDNPYLEQTLLENLFSEISTNCDYVVPQFNDKGGHPIIINRKIIERITAENNLNFSLKQILCNFEKKNLNCADNLTQININTMDEYNKFFLKS